MKFYIRTPNNSQIPTLPEHRNSSKPCEKKPIPPPPKTCPKPQPSKRKKISFSALKKDTICSLNEVEHFLCNFQNICKYIKLYKILH